MTKEETSWYWYGVSLGLGTAVIIADRNGGLSNAAREAIADQQKKIDDRDKERAHDAGLAEYESWIQHLPAMLEVASWGQSS